MELNNLKSQLQGHLGDGLVTIVGSGLSCAEGMPGMGALGDHLKATVPARIGPNDGATWTAIAEGIELLGLEGALLRAPPSPNLEAAIMQATSELILPAEQRIIAEVISGQRTLRFSRLLSHLLKPTSGIPVITTNYDRLLEIASEEIGLGVDTMFLGSYCAVLNEDESRLSFCREVSLKGRMIRYRYRERVRLYKPHGSLDWYGRGDCPVRHAGDLPLPRLIITPGLNKFMNGYYSPFDRHRDRANAAIDSASRFLIIGYGFNDDHLETHLKPMIRAGKPTVLLTRSLSANADALVRACPNATALEHAHRNGRDGTRLIRENQEMFFPELGIWDLHNFVDEVLEP